MSDERKTVRVRIAVAVSARGAWAANSWGGAGWDANCDGDDVRHMLENMMGDHTLDAIHYVEADVPIPFADRQTIEGKVGTEVGVGACEVEVRVGRGDDGTGVPLTARVVQPAATAAGGRQRRKAALPPASGERRKIEIRRMGT